MKVTVDRFYLVVASVLFIVIASFLDITMFDESLNDGFYTQILDVVKIFEGKLDYYSLFLIHVFRLAVILPFYLVHVEKLPSFLEAIFYIFYLFPILNSKLFKEIGIVRAIFIFFPIFVSYRTALGMCAMGYLFMVLNFNEKRITFLILSALLANLSSGIVLSWILIVLLNAKKIFSLYKELVPVFIIALIGFFSSFAHKFSFMFLTEGIKNNGNLFERSTIFVSFIDGDNQRFIMYVIMVLMLYGILLCRIAFKTLPKELSLFFIPAFVNIFFEGIGLISFTFIFIWYYYLLLLKPNKLSTYFKVVNSHAK